MGRRSFCRNVVCILPGRFVETIIRSIFESCDSTLMARWTNFFKEEYSYTSTTSLISLLKPLTNWVIFDSSLLGILNLVKVVYKSSKYSFTVLGPWWGRQTVRAYILSNHTKRPRLASCLAQCPIQFVATIVWYSLKKLGKLVRIDGLNKRGGELLCQRFSQRLIKNEFISKKHR